MDMMTLAMAKAYADRKVYTINLTELGFDAAPLMNSGGGTAEITHEDIPKIMMEAEKAEIVKLRVNVVGVDIETVCRAVLKDLDGITGLDGVAVINMSSMGMGLVEVGLRVQSGSRSLTIVMTMKPLS